MKSKTIYDFIISESNTISYGDGPFSSGTAIDIMDVVELIKRVREYTLIEAAESASIELTDAFDDVDTFNMPMIDKDSILNINKEIINYKK